MCSCDTDNSNVGRLLFSFFLFSFFKLFDLFLRTFLKHLSFIAHRGVFISLLIA